MIRLEKKSLTIDARMITFSGIGTYIKNVLPTILIECQAKKIDVNIICYKHEIESIKKICSSEVNIITAYAKIYSFKEQLELKRIIPKGTSLFWSPHYNIPLFYKGKLLVTIHDVFHLAKKEFVDGFIKKLYARIMFNAVGRKAAEIICVSHFTKNELIKYIPVIKNEINVIYNGVDRSWFEVKENPEKTHNNPYFIYVGNVKPHKNLANLLDAFNLIHETIPHKLMIVGKKEGFITSDTIVYEKAEKLKDKVIFTGYVSDLELQVLTKNASAMVFPSLYEGFGLPPIEAMACKTPTLVSNQASIPEICGEASLYFDPYNVNQIAEVLMKFVNDKKYSERLRVKGEEQARKYSWEKCSFETFKVIEKLLN